MTKFDSLKKKYNQLVKDVLEKNKSILIESFVEYYGEEFRKIIEKRYNETKFVWYIDWTSVDFVVNKVIPQADNPEYYAEFVKFNKSRKKSFLSKLFKRKNKLPDNLIGVSDESILNDEHVIEWINQTANGPEPTCFGHGTINNFNKFISFQILSLSEKSIIHEINHAITRDLLALLTEDDNFISPICKNGLDVPNKANSGETKNIEELLNDKASDEITKIFKAKGGDLSPICLDIPIIYFYEHNYYLIDEFYEEFKELQKIARISNNQNELVARIGKSEYKELIDIVNKYYSEDIDLCNLNKERSLPEIKNVIAKMKKNVLASNSYSKEKQIKELKALGYKLKMLNSQFSDEIEKDIGTIKKQ